MGLHHGFVTLTSRVGEGSRFVLHIPVGLSHFVPGEYEIREGSADYTGRICVIGSKLKEDELEGLFF